MFFKKLLKGGSSRVSNFLIFIRNQVSLNFRKFIKDQHQLTSTTGSDRYPELFSEAKVAVIALKKPYSILSFGCSTGEECFTMKSYFPDSKIVIGVDINKGNLRRAASRSTGSDIQFLFSTPKTIAANGQYGLIFCLSVLCRWEDTKDLANCENVYPFKKFTETVGFLAGQLLTGGLLIIYNSNFRFEDTPFFQAFEIVTTPSVSNSGFVHKFDSQNNRILENHRHCIYRKIG